MRFWFVRRLVVAGVTLFGITAMTFALVHLAPGEPVPGLSPENLPADAATVQALRDRYHLDDPLPQQYGRWLGRMARFDFGTSFVDHRPVRDKILERLPRTVTLNIAALLLIAVVAIPLGVLAAARPGSALDRLSGPFLYLLYSLPSFWVALVLQSSLAVTVGLFPLAGLHSEGTAGWTVVGRAADGVWHLALPAICLAYGSLAFYARFSRANLLEALGSDFVRAARARGLGEGRVLWRHALANAWLPFLTLAGLLLPATVSGSVIIERIFAWPGLGSLLFESLFTRDYPTILGLSSLTAVLVLAGTLGADLLYLAADPRLSRPGSAP
ncbi:MAG: ABC transporter permease [Acidobacteriota bacterium]